MVWEGTDQVVDAEQKGLYAAAAMWVSAGRDGQVTPHQLRQELQRKALKTRLTTAVKLEQLMTHRLQQLREREIHYSYKSVGV